MFNIRGILNRRNDQSRSSESRLSEDGVENSASSAEGFLCPHCFLAFPTAVALQNHYESNHSDDINHVSGEGRDMFSCPACKMKLGSDIELQSHYSRHHSDSKEDVEIEAMAMQVNALEEGKALLQSELQAVRTQSSELLKENVKIREERDGLELKAAKLAGELADLKADMDELKTRKTSVESALKFSEEKIKKLEVEIQQKPEADDASLLKQEIVSVQKMMDQLALQREAEKETLQKQCDAIQEKCLKLQSEKTELENLIRSYPKKEENESLQSKITEMSISISQLERNLDLKEVEKEKLQLSLEKYRDYEDVKKMLAEKESTLEESKKMFAEKDAVISKLEEELKTLKENVEEMKIGREKLFSKIEEGEGASVAILQLKEENARLQEQFVYQLTMYSQTINENEQKIDDLRSSLKKATSELQSLKEKNSELQSDLVQKEKKVLELQKQKDSICEELNLKIAKLTATGGTDKARINNLEKEVQNMKKSLEEKELALENLQKDLKEEKSRSGKNVEKIEMQKKDLEKRLGDLANTLPRVQADLMEKEKKLSETEKKLLQVSEQLNSEKESKSKLEEEIKCLKEKLEETLQKLEKAEKIASQAEETKEEFCVQISLLNEELMKKQLMESELNDALDNMAEVKSQVNEKCLSLEEENKNLRLSVTSLQNEKNSLLSELEKIKKSAADLSDLCAAQKKEIKELTDICDKEKSNAEQILKDFNLAKEIYLKDKVQLQKQIENLENDCAKQLSQIQETVKTLENNLEESEEKITASNLALEEAKKLLKQKETEWEEKKSHHIAQVGVLTENVKTLREDLAAEQKRRENLDQKLDEISGTKLELEAKLENALDERRGLLERCLRSEAECERVQKSAADMRRKYEDCVAALQELGRENQTLQVENMKHITRKWADDSEVTHCTACGKLFTVTVRKHHCRNCGNIFCNECSAKTATVASSKKPVRVCDVCYADITK